MTDRSRLSNPPADGLVTKASWHKAEVTRSWHLDTLDTAALIKDNALALIGRLTNPQEQRIWALIPALPRKWNHFAYWMVILQRWEPVISATFPSMIPFWIKIKGLPLHYWHDDMVVRVGQELGTLENHELTRTSARVRVLVDGLKPLIKESIVEFDSGEESPIYLEYEKLEAHCSYCYSLLHLQKQCPKKKKEEDNKEKLTETRVEEKTSNRGGEYPHTSNSTRPSQATSQHFPWKGRQTWQELWRKSKHEANP